jgi:rare lipoprotein A (peptidoglycan hydrolase)
VSSRTARATQRNPVSKNQKNKTKQNNNNKNKTKQNKTNNQTKKPTQVTTDAGKDVEKKEHSSIADGIASWYNHFRKSVWCVL